MADGPGFQSLRDFDFTNAERGTGEPCQPMPFEFMRLNCLLNTIISMRLLLKTLIMGPADRSLGYLSF